MLGETLVLLPPGANSLLTVVPLSDPILYSPSFGEIGDLGPIFVGIGTGTECTASAVRHWILFMSRDCLCLWIAIAGLTLHGRSIVHDAENRR